MGNSRIPSKAEISDMVRRYLAEALAEDKDFKEIVLNPYYLEYYDILKYIEYIKKTYGIDLSKNSIVANKLEELQKRGKIHFIHGSDQPSTSQGLDPISKVTVATAGNRNREYEDKDKELITPVIAKDDYKETPPNIQKMKDYETDKAKYDKDKNRALAKENIDLQDEIEQLKQDLKDKDKEYKKGNGNGRGKNGK